MPQLYNDNVGEVLRKYSADSSVTVGPGESNVSATGVQQIVAGNNITINPAGGQGVVTIQANLSGAIGSYSNANVANYLPVYGGNILFGNLLAPVSNNWGAGIQTNSNIIFSGANVVNANNLSNLTTSFSLNGLNQKYYELFQATNVYQNEIEMAGAGLIFLSGYGNTANNQANNALTAAVTSTGISVEFNRANGYYRLINLDAESGGIVASDENGLLTNISNGNIITTGNVTGDYYFGNGAFLSGISAGNITGAYGNANVANYLQVLTSNVTTTANVQAAYFIGNGSQLTGLPASYSNANVAAFLPTYTGNLQSGNLLVVNSAVIQGNLTVLGNTTTINANTLNITDKDITVANGAVTLAEANGAGLIVGQGNLANIIFNNPANAWTLYPGVSTPGNVSGTYILGNGAFLTGLAATYSNANVANYLPIYGGNISANNVAVISNVSAAYYVGNGAFLTGIATSSYSNANVAAYLASNSNVIITTTGNIWSDATIRGRDVNAYSALTVGDTTGASYSQLFNDVLYVGRGTNAVSRVGVGIVSTTGNVVGNNIIANNYVYGNGAFLTGLAATYSNANVANFLQVLTSNVTTTANVQAAYLIGNIRNTTGGYDDANVAAYLPTYTGNLAASSDIIALYANAATQSNAIANLQSNVTTLQGNIITIDSNIANLYANAATQSNAIIAINSDIANLTGNAGEQANAIANLQSNVTTLQGNIVSINSNIANLYANAADQSNAIANLQLSQYSNANVANYLPVYGGNISFSNITGVTNANAFITTTATTGVTKIWAGAVNVGTEAMITNTFPVVSAATNGTTTIVPGQIVLTRLANVGYEIGSWTVNSLSLRDNNSNTIPELILISSNAEYGGTIRSLLTKPNGIRIVEGSGTGIQFANVSANCYFGNGYYLTGIQASNITGAYGNADVANYLPIYTGNLASSSDIIALYANAADQSNAITILQGNVVNINSNIANLYANAADQSNAIGLLQSNVVNINSNIANLYANAGDQSNAITILQGNVVNINSNIANLYANAADQSNAITILQGNVVNINSNIANLYANAADQSNAIANLQASAYSDANVANYLPTYTGNLQSGNLLIVNSAVIQGNLTVLGNTTTINANTLNIADKDITVANGVATAAEANGAGLIVGQSNLANIIFNNPANAWTLYPGVATPGNITGSHIIGNGYFLSDIQYTNITGAYGNAQVSNFLQVLTSNVTTSANVQAAYFIGNGSQLTGIQASNITGAYGNANVANYLPTYTGNLAASSDIIALYANAATQSNAIANLQAAQYSNANVANYLPTYTGDISAGNLSVTESIYGNYITANINMVTEDLSANTINVGSNLLGADADFAGNVIVGADVVVTGNVTAAYHLGNGYFLTGIQASNITGAYGNANVAAYLPTYTGNLALSSDIIALYANAAQQSNAIANLQAAQYSNANVANYLPTYTGDISAGNITVTNDIFANYITATLDLYTGNVVASEDISANNFSGGNINVNQTVSGNNGTFTSNVTAALYLGNGYFLTGIQASNITGAYSNANVANYLPTYTGNLALSSDIIALYANAIQQSNAIANLQALQYANANVSNFLANGFGSNTITTTGNIQAGTVKGTNFQAVSSAGGTLKNATGVTQASWGAGGGDNFSVSVSTNLDGANAQIDISPTGTGHVHIKPTGTGAVEIAPVNTGSINNMVIGNVTPAAANVTTLGATGNVTAAYYFGNGSQLTGIASAYGNANVAAYLASNSNVVITTTGNITTFANLNTNNVVGTPNTNTIITTNGYNWTFDIFGNITLPANVFGFKYANGQQVSLGGSYSNADVANYLPTFTGNVGAGNLNLTGNIIDTGAIAIITGGAGNIALAPNGSNIIIATTTGANITGTVTATGNITTSANVQANYFIGNGSQLTGITTTVEIFNPFLLAGM